MPQPSYFSLLVCGLILVRSVLAEEAAAPAADENRTKFIAEFSNGVQVELIGINYNPSAGHDWWRPDGTPLEQRPYTDVHAKMGPGPDGIAREFCWRWINPAELDIQTNMRTNPNYHGYGGGVSSQEEQANPGLDACALSLPEKPESCAMEFSISVPATAWSTALDTQAGYASSMGSSVPTLGQIAVSFLPPVQDGADTLIAVGYQIPRGEVRLAGIDSQGREQIAQVANGVGINGFSMTQYRFSNSVASEFKRWQLQTRLRQSEVVFFRNVSLEPNHITDVQVDEADPTQPALPGPEASLKSPQELASVRQAEIVSELAKDYGYRLAEGEVLKYIDDGPDDLRMRLADRMMNSLSGFVSLNKLPAEEEPTFQPCLLLFQFTPPDGTLLQSTYLGTKSIGNVLDEVFQLKPQELGSDSGILNTYMPGDWVVRWNPNEDHEINETELRTLETILNDHFRLDVQLEWSERERESVVLSGDFAPQDPQFESGSGVESMFEIPVRRSDISASVGTYRQFLRSIGAALMLPVVDETQSQPSQEKLVWQYTGDIRPDQNPLPAQQLEVVLGTLARQTGWKTSMEKRKVRQLLIHSQGKNSVDP